MKNLFLLFLTTTLSTTILAQNVYIPDTNFKNYLLGNIAINGNLDTAIQVFEANAFSGLLNISNKNIADLTGIEAFINMTGLFCNSNQITAIDMSNSPNLTTLGCGDNQLSSLNISNNIALNLLSTNNNLLTSIDVTNNTNLTSLYLQDNQLSSLDLINNTALLTLSVSQNNITTIDLSNNVSLKNLYVENTAISTIDLSNHTNLQIVWLDSNNLSSLNIKNGDNINLGSFKAQSNPNLTCIQVDDSAYSTTNWTNIDPQSFFSTNCGVGINEADNLNELITIYPNPASYYFNIAVSSSSLNETYLLQLIDVTGKIVQQELVDEGINKISIAKLSKGFYQVLISNSSGILTTKKLIINH
ncbi:MAG: hypothetical protein A3K10_02825 [Bacteroidetes bacterium RIFCSPLOWO2_12_FULL_31_6]|nr:MAG: hypothetical protein A3K10_02825 [Bacteroidetes bacterium RIFCSPLOWO2_12_FULL_31_6]